jgi:hypothetical protein
MTRTQCRRCGVGELRPNLLRLGIRARGMVVDADIIGSPTCDKCHYREATAEQVASINALVAKVIGGRKGGAA